MSDVSIIHSGTCGEQVRWTLDSRGTLTVFGEGAIRSYNWSESAPWHGLSMQSVVIEPGVTAIGAYAFMDCGLSDISIADSVTRIESAAFLFSRLRSVTLPDKLTMIPNCLFQGCAQLTSVTIPPSVEWIGSEVFLDCKELKVIKLHENIREIGYDAFDHCVHLTIVCPEGSYAHRFCEKRHLSYVFDYQFEAFQGILPPGIEKLTSPFPADEERPFIFVSYSHKDRERVFDIAKTLYESGWNVWYDEGLTIGDRYNETLEEHIKNCTVFLLFVSHNSVRSDYIMKHEIPWARLYGRPIIKCILDEGIDIPVDVSAVIATVDPSGTEEALENAEGLVNGKPRVAGGISVVVNPADRTGMDGENFAYCIYSADSAEKARAILLEVQNSGCAIYDAPRNGEDGQQRQNSAGLIAFIDKAFLSDERLVGVLTEEFVADKDIAVCQIGPIEEGDIPSDLAELYQMQWLNYVHKSTLDLNTHLVRHLQKIGCRNTAVLPGFSYEKTDAGIIITRYTGLSTEPRIESAYGGIPVIEIADGAFEYCNHIRRIVIPDSVQKIGYLAFHCCASLTSVTLPAGLTHIAADTFRDCPNLRSISIPGSVSSIGARAFLRCAGLKSITMAEGVTNIGSYAFGDCIHLTSVTLPDSITEIGYSAFRGCTELASVVLPDKIAEMGNQVFSGCDHLVVTTGRGSYAAEYAKEYAIPVVFI